MPKTVADLLRSVAGARVYDLEQPRSMEMPIHPSNRPVYVYHLHKRHRDRYGEMGSRSAASGVVMMIDHSGTHLDALSHQAEHLRFHGGIEVTPQVETPRGMTVHGAETVLPIVTRGLLLDVCAVKGQDPLPAHYRITLADMKAAMQFAGVTPQPGDALLVRTGYDRLWGDEARYLEAAGVGREATAWVAEQNVRCVGCDNSTWDEIDERDPETGATMYGHLHLLVRKGIHIIENLMLEPLSRDRCWEFLFVCAPLKMVGATGAPVRPLALA